MRRIVTYDVNTSDNDYDDFYDYLSNHIHKKLTESTYEIESTLDLNAFCTKIRSLFKEGDNVYIISVSNQNTLFSKKIR